MFLRRHMPLFSLLFAEAIGRGVINFGLSLVIFCRFFFHCFGTRHPGQAVSALVLAYAGGRSSGLDGLFVRMPPFAIAISIVLCVAAWPGCVCCLASRRTPGVVCRSYAFASNGTAADVEVGRR